MRVCKICALLVCAIFWDCPTLTAGLQTCRPHTGLRTSKSRPKDPQLHNPIPLQVQRHDHMREHLTRLTAAPQLKQRQSFGRRMLSVTTSLASPVPAFATPYNSYGQAPVFSQGNGYMPATTLANTFSTQSHQPTVAGHQQYSSQNGRTYNAYGVATNPTDRPVTITSAKGANYYPSTVVTSTPQEVTQHPTNQQAVKVSAQLDDWTPTIIQTAAPVPFTDLKPSQPQNPAVPAAPFAATLTPSIVPVIPTTTRALPVSLQLPDGSRVLVPASAASAVPPAAGGTSAATATPPEPNLHNQTQATKLQQQQQQQQQQPKTSTERDTMPKVPTTQRPELISSQELTTYSGPVFPANCEGSWSAWSDCSKACGDNQTARFIVETTAAFGGSDCEAANGQLRSRPCSEGCQLAAPDPKQFVQDAQSASAAAAAPSVPALFPAAAPAATPAAANPSLSPAATSGAQLASPALVTAVTTLPRPAVLQAAAATAGPAEATATTPALSPPSPTTAAAAMPTTAAAPAQPANTTNQPMPAVSPTAAAQQQAPPEMQMQASQQPQQQQQTQIENQQQPNAPSTPVATPVPSPAGLPRAKQNTYCIPATPGITFNVLAAGDSITQGSVPSKNLNRPYAIKLTQLLKQKLGNSANAVAAGLGGGGIFMTGFNEPITFGPYLQDCLLNRGPWDVVVIMVGINDLLRGGRSATDVWGGLQPRVSQILKDGRPVVLIPPTPAPGFEPENSGKEAERKKFARLLVDAAKQHASNTTGEGPQIYTLDLQSGPLDFYKMSIAERAKWLDDGLHLTEYAYDWLGGTIYDAIASKFCR